MPGPRGGVPTTALPCLTTFGSGRRTSNRAGPATLSPGCGDDPSVIEQVRQTLVGLTRDDAKRRAALSAALADRAIVRRSVAAEVLAEVGDEGQRPALRMLLRDPEEPVRYRVALSLAPRGERAAVGVLIDLLDRVSADEAWQIEELLLLAGENPPQAELGSTPAERRKCRQAWAA